MLYDTMTIPQAVALQEELSAALRFDLLPDTDIRSIAGADISSNKGSNAFFAAIVVLRFPDMVLQSYALAHGSSDFPYVPGYLGFREVPTLLKAWELLPDKPDILVLDGQGILHPRRMGIAAHFGVLTGQVTIGCAKNALFGQYEAPALQALASNPVYAHGGVAGHVLRTRAGTKPVFVSPGYGLDVAQALVRQCIGRYRIPEPTRIAPDMVNAFRKGALKAGFHKVVQNGELF